MHETGSLPAETAEHGSAWMSARQVATSDSVQCLVGVVSVHVVPAAVCASAIHAL